MGLRSTFSGFYVARDGLNAARANLEITGQNITNVNTEGYTRQRVDLYSRAAGTKSERYAQGLISSIGEGVTIGSFSQYRDPYLDLKYRTENAGGSDTNKQLDILKDLGYVFDDAVEDDFNTRFSDLISQLQSLAQTPTDPVCQNIVKTSSSMLVQMFNDYSTQLDTVMDQTIDSLQNGTVKQFNACLSNIAHVNQAIKSAQVSGNPALELQDERNKLLDELSGYCKIETVQTPVDVGAGVKVDKTSVNMILANGDKFCIVDDGKAASLECHATSDHVELSLMGFDGKPMEVSKGGSVTLTDGRITDELSQGQLHAVVGMINSKGAFDTPPNKQNGIGYYHSMLDSLARGFATMMNDANSTATEDKPLFAANDTNEPIGAGNIVLSEKWLNSTGAYITPTKAQTVPGVDNKDDNTNILYMISQFSKDFDFNAPDGTVVFNGTMQECISNLKGTLGIQISDVTRQNKTNAANVSAVQNERLSLSSVNLDEEGINLIMYNQSLTAASRFMTTLDEAVDTIISKMGLVGR